MVQKTQRGATALFIVIFSTLLLSVITVSFVGLINRDKVQSTDNELSQSAYDASLAGVEDAKRVLAACLGGNGNNSSACAAMNAGECSTIVASGVVGSSGVEGETLLKTLQGDGEDINQAYTCVKASLDSDDVLYELPKEQSRMIPIRAAGSVNQIEIQWQKNGDAGIAAPLSGAHTGSCTEGKLCTLEDWGNMPSLMRVQLITPGSAINLSTLDDSNQGATFFLYPSLAGGAPQAIEQSITARYTSTAESSGLKTVTSCSKTQFTVGYACTARIRLANPISANNGLSFIRLTSLYKNASVRVSLKDNSGGAVQFRGVQPVVDATGRANDVFRRVEARLSTLTNAIYPEAAVDITGSGNSGSVCKNFYVTDSTSGDNNTSLSCTP
ncbi:MAG TPA: hypothetical protein PKD19_02660 [Candidatus Saccharibacteria bacterium]|nr:hypothetical protein [Candidatus Saccharibacteria bacterium]HMR38537.1 hypothetical protein [Candidatus Saccharibacteria bacterium]